jgi:hypothetical protein
MWQLLQKSERDVYHAAQNTINSIRNIKDTSTARIRKNTWRAFRQNSGDLSRAALRAMRIFNRHRRAFPDRFGWSFEGAFPVFTSGLRTPAV